MCIRDRVIGEALQRFPICRVFLYLQQLIHRAPAAVVSRCCRGYIPFVAVSYTHLDVYKRQAQYARENRIPCFGICLGMQIMVIEFARNVLGYKDANSSEFTPCLLYTSDVYKRQIFML